MRSIGQRATSAAWVSWSMRACWLTAAVSSARKCGEVGLGVAGAVDLGAERGASRTPRSPPRGRRRPPPSGTAPARRRSAPPSASAAPGRRWGGRRSFGRSPVPRKPAGAGAKRRASAIRCRAASAAPPPLSLRRRDRRGPRPARGSRRSGCRCRCDALEPEQRQAARAVVADGLVVRGLAADHAAERDVAVEGARPGSRARSPSGSRARPAPRWSRAWRRRRRARRGRRRAARRRCRGRRARRRASTPHRRRRSAARQGTPVPWAAIAQPSGAGIGRVPAIDRP